jgi:hypothetical protein
MSSTLGSAFRVSRDCAQCERQRTGCVIGLKAIASPQATGAGARDGAQLNPRERAKAHGRDTVPSSTRLDCFVDLVRRWTAPMFWKTGQPPGLSHLRSWEAVRECGPEATRYATAGTANSGDAVRCTIPHPTPKHGTRELSAANLRFSNAEVAVQLRSWPVMGQLATDFGICGQIGRNPLDIQGDLATDRKAGIARNPCFHRVIRGSCCGRRVNTGPSAPVEN